MPEIFVIEVYAVVLLASATLAGVFTQRIRVPYTVGLVAVGTVLAVLYQQLQIEIAPEIILGIFVPPLIFEAAFHLPLGELRRNMVQILALAIVGVLLTTFLVGGIVYLGAGIPLAYAIVFGSIIAATDPKEGLTISAQVNYVGKGANLYDLGYEYDGSADVVIGYLRMTYLWEKIRAQGGAYGVFSRFDDTSGVFTFLSYRDPNVAMTIENYDKAAAFLKSLDSSRLTDNELTKAIIAANGDLDAYQLPDAKGYTSMIRYLTNRTDEFRQKTRDEVLSTNGEDFIAFGEVLERQCNPTRSW